MHLGMQFLGLITLVYDESHSASPHASMANSCNNPQIACLGMLLATYLMISFPRVRIIRKNVTNHNNIMRITTFVIAATIFINSLQALY